MSGVLKKEKGRTRKGKIRKCAMCGDVNIVRMNNNSPNYRRCAYIANAFKINKYIKRPERDEKTGRYISGNKK